MHRTTMLPPSRDLRPAPLNPNRAFHSAQRPVGGREYAPSLHDLIHAPRIDDHERRALRARAKFTWNLTDKGLDTPQCRVAAWVFSPFSWHLPTGPKGW